LEKDGCGKESPRFSRLVYDFLQHNTHLTLQSKGGYILLTAETEYFEPVLRIYLLQQLMLRQPTTTDTLT
jgi:hypothetical protein